MGRITEHLSAKRLLASVPVVVVCVVTLLAVGCVHRSGGSWMIQSAPLPEGWPALSPVGEVVLRTYPVYRAASVDEASLGEAEMTPLFMELFGHISRNDIAMTTPVDMGYRSDDNGGLAMDRMAFLYRTRELGPSGSDGAVVIADVEERTYASAGVRGDYSEARYRAGLAIVDAWLEGNDAYTRDGDARYLGYNGPFIPGFMKYGEVQIPVVPTIAE